MVHATGKQFLLIATKISIYKLMYLMEKKIIQQKFWIATYYMHLLYMNTEGQFSQETKHKQAPV